MKHLTFSSSDFEDIYGPENRNPYYACMLCLGYSDDVTVLWYSPDSSILFQEGHGWDDNGGGDLGDLKPGIYFGRIKPWSSKSYEGDYDAGIDFHDEQLLFHLPKRPEDEKYAK